MPKEALPGLSPDPIAGAIPLRLVRRDALESVLEGAPERIRAWLTTTGFKADAGSVALVPGPDGDLAEAWVGVPAKLDLWSLAPAAEKLPAQAYRLDGGADPADATRLAIGWSLALYRFTRYKDSSRDLPRLVLPAGADAAEVARQVAATTLVRDLVNTPAEDMGPPELASAAQALAAEFGAGCQVIVGDELLAQNWPLVHAVGRAAAKPPRLIDLTWGDPSHPLVALVGKGVCFDSGGLDIKPSSGMLLMKKDMGGAAHALGVARLVMSAGLKVRLRVLIPAVENAVSGNAFRPMDIIRSRKGLTVEIGNTDAEGRLVLADALAEADREKPALLLDFATLTGAARTALGPDLPALFCNEDALAADYLAAADAAEDPLWRLPLWHGYRKAVDGKIADITNAPPGLAGAVTAALFLERFVSAGTPWAHLDLYAWNPTARPGRPEGGEALGMRAAFALLRRRFGA